MLKAYFKSQCEIGAGDILPTPKNVQWFWELGMFFSQEKLPTFAIVENGRVVSIMLCGPPLAEWDLKFKSLNIYASYTLPSQEHKFHHITLIRRLRNFMWENGWERVNSAVLLQNQRVLKMMFKGDVWPVAAMLQYQASDPQFDTGERK